MAPCSSILWCGGPNKNKTAHYSKPFENQHYPFNGNHSFQMLHSMYNPFNTPFDNNDNSINSENNVINDNNNVNHFNNQNLQRNLFEYYQNDNSPKKIKFLPFYSAFFAYWDIEDKNENVVAFLLLNYHNSIQSADSSEAKSVLRVLKNTFEMKETEIEKYYSRFYMKMTHLLTQFKLNLRKQQNAVEMENVDVPDNVNLNNDFAFFGKMCMKQNLGLTFLFFCYLVYFVLFRDQMVLALFFEEYSLSMRVFIIFTIE